MKKCKLCNKEFELNSNAQIYCCFKCKVNRDNLVRKEARRKIANTPEYKLLTKKWRDNRKEKKIISDKIYRANHRILINKYQKQRKELTKKLNKVIVLELIEENKFIFGEITCTYCLKKCQKWHLDHIIPLCKGGTNDKNNLTISCPKCNQEKGSIDVDVFLKMLYAKRRKD